ncbi:hypothetical protein SAMN05216480_10941 [Pustulibacterium marinum]|uniref:Uncharacterized protein n=1 Tax=Pustulibacterium marinum TaxID=1224947 RepID=A0A1I7HGF2_9FLAO|nr:hypothetical protein [Pustulibacterium marinum]SFU59741.1 hypothetical protein SAMN05216480_10941 [Pustulibacterium marinum]
MNTFTFQRVHRNKKAKPNYDIYRFTNDFNDKVIVEVFFYDYNIYAVKFFLKRHSISRDKYSMAYSKEDKTDKSGKEHLGNMNCLKVLNTILKIIREISKNDSIASFGIMGAPKISEMDAKKNKKNINSDGTVANTKRYKVYHLYIRRYFSPEQFEYIDSKTSSILLLRNRKNDKFDKRKAELYIVNNIIPNL